MIKGIKGLSEAEVSASREKHGDNALVKEKTKGFFGKLIENLNDPIIRVLMIAVVLEIIFSFGSCNWWEVGGIIVAVMIAAVVSTVSEYGSEKAFRRMQEGSERAVAMALRDGELVELSQNDIVVGDVLRITSGDTVAADGRVIYGRITVDQSALNGESIEVAKYPSARDSTDSLSSPSALFRGSIVCSGEAYLRVERVGANTFYGNVAKDVQVETRISPLKLRLSALAKTISRIGYFMAFLVGLTYLFFAFFADNGFEPEHIAASFRNIPFVVSTLSHAITLMITVIVVAVPEGLPMMITVVLSANMRRMINDKVMVKKLVGIETAGSMNILFTDKTGTLTCGKSTVCEIITVGGDFTRSAALKRAPYLYRYLHASATLGAPESAGNSTDKALRAFFENEYSETPAVVSSVPFSSDRKYSSITLADGITVTRGAPEIIIAACTESVDGEGNRKLLKREEIMEKYTRAASVGGRVIAVSLTFPDGTVAFAALAVLKDKLRHGVRESVAAVKRAGVSVVMVTGDGKETATAIAKESGILSGGGRVITHSELEAMSDHELRALIPTLAVVARALPSDKTRLVRAAQECGLVVGMTGDGINDAPSLKLADVGFSMGSGTDIAKSASDIVILDDSFEAICKTVLYGRTIFKSIRKFITFQLMMNLTACGVSLIGQFIGFENPITIIQMLWINIIMDTLGGLAFAGEPPLEYYMLEKPKSREEPILSRDMLHSIIITGGYTLLICIMFMGLGFFRLLFRPSADNSYFLTGFYALFVFAGIFNCFNARSERLNLLSNIGKNKLFGIIMLSITLIQLIMIYFGGEIFRCAPLSFRELLNVVLLAASVIPFDGLRRIFKKLSRKRENGY